MAENNQSNFFGRLKKLFSNQAIVRIDDDGKRKVVDTDERQMTTNLTNLRDRYTKIQRSFYEQQGGAQSMAYHQVRRELFRDYDAMDNDSILSSALDIYADECLGPDTVIPLLNGEKKTISELYSEGYTNFWVYGLDADGNFMPVKADRVAYNGKKKVKKIVLEDDTVIYATDNHIWVTSDLSMVETSKLKIGDGLYTLKTSISDYSSMKGYELIEKKDGDKIKYEFTHRIVGNTIPSLRESKSSLKKPVLHHTSFNKLNNDPNFLTYMEWQEHTKLHREYNLMLWKYRKLNPDKIESMIAAIKDGHVKYWTDEKRKEVSERQSNYMKTRLRLLSTEDRKNIYGSPGNKNGMYGNGYKLKGENNGRWVSDYTRIEDVDIQSIVDFLLEYNGTLFNINLHSILNTEFGYNLNETEYIKVCNRICKLHNIDTIKQLKKKNNIENLKYKLSELKTEIRHYSGNVYRNVDKLCKNIGTTRSDMYPVIQDAGYKNFSEFIDSTNHKIKYISEDYIELDVYDLVNAGDNHIYAIETIDGGKLYTHNCTTHNEFGDILQITSPNENVREVLHNLFYDVMNIEFNLWPWVRNMTKYGDFFLTLELGEKQGIVNVMPHSVYDVERIEGSDPENNNYVKFRIENDYLGKKDYENYEMAHFRLLSDTNFLPYGKSMIEGGRRIWKQLSLMEDAMMIHRIMRAPEKRVFKIDIGNIPPTEVDNYMQRIINKMKKVPFLDKKTGDYNLKYNIQNLTEDYFLPVRGSDSGTSIDNLGGLEYAAIEDIEYLKGKLFAALKVPKAYLSYDENVNGKATLAAEDVRFARTIERIQRTVISELTKIAIIHLYSLGISDAEMVNFELSLTNASTIYEQEKVNLWSEKVRLASDIKGLNMLSNDWIYQHIFGISNDEVSEQRVNLINDLKDRFRYNAIEQEGNDPAVAPEKTDVEQEIEELKREITGTDKGGRPREGNTYGKDKHPYGRDALGNKENWKERKRDTIQPNSTKLAREVINKLSYKSTLLKENDKK
jgi:hypothetical protein